MKLAALKTAKSLKEFAPLLGYKPKHLSFILYKIPDDVKYTTFDIPKKCGDKRSISAPVERLKLLQNRLANYLYDCEQEIEAAKKSLKKRQNYNISHGFKKGLSIVSNAEKHKNKRFVFNLDLKDFFPSINFGRVRGFFIKNQDYKLSPEVATVIAQIACWNNALPQGSPCSPVISNMLAHILDVRLVQLAKKHKCTYSRYADDLTFSTNMKNFPSAIAKIDKGSLLEAVKCQSTRGSDWLVGEQLRRQIEKFGFSINDKKTRMQLNQSRQLTTGLIVNRKVNVKSEYYRVLRSQCNELFQRDSYYRKVPNPENPDEIINEIGNMNQLEGTLSFVYHIKSPEKVRRQKLKTYQWNREHGPAYERKNSRRAFRGITKLYSKFLHYKYFFSLEQPLFVCEGKTDNVYLSCAIRQLADRFPLLAKKKGNEVTFLFDLLNNHGAVKKIWDLPSGAGFLAKIIQTFPDILAPFKGEGKRAPVIMIVDNDDGPKGKSGVFKNIEKYGHDAVDGSEKFYHVIENLYVVPLPKIKSDEDIDFEGLFDVKTLETPYNKRTFARKVEDYEKEYGKSDFAFNVIKPNQSKVNFNGFIPLLDVIVKVMDHYSKELAK